MQRTWTWTCHKLGKARTHTHTRLAQLAASTIMSNIVTQADHIDDDDAYHDAEMWGGCVLWI